LCLRSSPIESLVLVSAPPVRRSVARLAKLRAPKENVRVCVEAGRSDFLPQDAPRDALRGEHVVQEILISDLWIFFLGFFFPTPGLGPQCFGGAAARDARDWE
jgi:hypothetical protein